MAAPARHSLLGMKAPVNRSSANADGNPKVITASAKLKRSSSSLEGGNRDRTLRRGNSSISATSLASGATDASVEEERGSSHVNTRGPAINGIIARRARFKRGFSRNLTDAVIQKKEADKQEKANKQAVDVGLKEHGIYVECSKGAKEKWKPNQDSWCVHKCKTHAIYGVFDGHGSKGHDVANFVKRHLPEVLEGDPRFLSSLKNERASFHPFASLSAVIKDAFKTVDGMIEIRGIDAETSGTTATIVVHSLLTNRIAVAHCGNSGAAIERGRTGGNLYMTPDHKPGISSERERIEASDAYVQVFGDENRIYKNGEDWPGLEVSRSFGFLQGKKAGITSEPDICEVDLMTTDEFIIICSDGVWKWMTAIEAGAICKKALQRSLNPAQVLKDNSAKRWAEEAFGFADDITAICVDLRNTARRLSITLNENLVDAKDDNIIIVFQYWDGNGGLKDYEVKAAVKDVTVEALHRTLQKMPEYVTENIHSVVFKEDENAWASEASTRCPSGDEFEADTAPPLPEMYVSTMTLGCTSPHG